MSADNLQTWLQSVGTCDMLEKYIIYAICEVSEWQKVCGVCVWRLGPDSEEIGSFSRPNWMEAVHGRYDIQGVL